MDRIPRICIVDTSPAVPSLGSWSPVSGWDFRYFTHLYKTKTGSLYYIVYDQAYLPKEGNPDSYLLVKFDERQK